MSSRSLLLLLLLLAGAGCQTVPPDVHVEEFETPPPDWLEVDGRREQGASALVIEGGRWRTPDRGLWVLDRELDRGFEASIELSVVPALRGGHAGLVLEEIQDHDPTRSGDEVVLRTVLALDGSGHWAGLDGHPLHLSSRPANRDLPGGTWPGPLEIRIRSTGEEASFSIAGRGPLFSVPLTEPSRVRPPGGIHYRLGVYASFARLEVEHVIVGHAPPGKSLPLGEIVDTTLPGGAAVHLPRALDRLERGESLASVLEALASVGAGEPGLAEAWSRIRGSLSDSLTRPEHRALVLAFSERTGLDLVGGASPSLTDSVFLTRAREALGAGRAGEALVLATAASVETGRPVETIFPTPPGVDLDPTPLDLRIEYRAPDRNQMSAEGLRQAVLTPVREHYGTLRRGDPARLVVSMAVAEASLDHERSRATRRVFRRGRRPVELEALRARYRRDLESLEEERLDAASTVEMIRSARMDPRVRGSLRSFRFRLPRETTLTLPEATGRRLLAREDELLELAGQIEELERGQLEEEGIGATLTLDYVTLEVHYRVTLDGKVLLGDEVTVRGGLEQWIHPARPESGLAEARHDPALVDQFTEQLLERLGRRLSAALDLDRLLARLDSETGTAFLVELARQSREPAARHKLSSWIRTHHAIGDHLVESVVDRLSR